MCGSAGEGSAGAREGVGRIRASVPPVHPVINGQAYLVLGPRQGGDLRGPGVDVGRDVDWRQSARETGRRRGPTQSTNVPSFSPRFSAARASLRLPRLVRDGLAPTHGQSSPQV